MRDLRNVSFDEAIRREVEAVGRMELASPRKVANRLAKIRRFEDEDFDFSEEGSNEDINRERWGF